MEAQQHVLGCSQRPASEACQSPRAGLSRHRLPLTASAQEAALTAHQAKAAHAAENMTQESVDAELAKMNKFRSTDLDVQYPLSNPAVAAPNNPRQTSINCSAVGGRFLIPHWKQVCKAIDNLHRPLTSLLPSFHRHRIPASWISVCLDNVAKCITSECIPEALRGVPWCKRTKEWLFLNSYTVFFKLNPLVDVPAFLRNLAKRRNPIRAAKAARVARVSKGEGAKWRPRVWLFTFISSSH